MTHPTSSYILPPTTGPAAPATGPVGLTGTEPGQAALFSHFGFGVIRPFQRDKRGDFAAAGGKALIQAAVGQILGTQAASEFTQGELPWRPDFGSLIHFLRHRENTEATDEVARTFVVQALQRWEPRIRVTGVTIGRSSQEQGGLNSLIIRVRYNFIDITTGAIVLEDLETGIVV